MKPICAFLSFLRSLTARPLLFWSLIALLAASLLFALLIWRQRIRIRHAKEAASTAPIPPEQTAPLQATLSFPSLIELLSPISGKLLAAEENDRIEGRGCAILSSEGKVYSPCDGRVTSIADDHRMLTLESKGGATLTVCIGKTNAPPLENGFIPCAKAGDAVKEGDLLLSFDLEALENAGYDLTATVVIENADQYDEIKVSEARKVSVGDSLLTLVPKRNKNESPQ